MRGRNARADDRPPSGFNYQQAMRTLEGGDTAGKTALARNSQTPPEILYYLAETGSWEVRVAAAANPKTPSQADLRLAGDTDENVRAELARKLGRLLPDVSDAERTQLREQAIVIIEALAQDQAPRVRALIAEAIKSDPRIPHETVLRLARDPDLLVCGPVLEYSPLLNDTDLKEIIAACQVTGALACIARRASVSEDVSDALARTGDIAAVSALLSNPNAQIREDTLDAILDGAPTVEAWHEPLTLRANLSIRAMRRIAGFVAASLVDRMVERQALSEEVARELLLAVRERIDGATVDAQDLRSAEQEAALVVARGRFDDGWVLDCIAEGRRTVVVVALGLASRIGVTAARKIVESRSGRAITALCWRARLSARVAYDVQQKIGFVPAPQLMTPRGGTDYPLGTDEMAWLLDTFAGD